jgi:hypothetical protein
MRFTFVVGAVLATAGTALAVVGIQLQSSSNLVATGFVLLCGAGVFALLTLGGRRAASR